MSAATGKSLILEFYIFCIAQFIALHFRTCVLHVCKILCKIESNRNNNVNANIKKKK